MAGHSDQGVSVPAGRGGTVRFLVAAQAPDRWGVGHRGRAAPCSAMLPAWADTQGRPGAPRREGTRAPGCRVAAGHQIVNKCNRPGPAHARATSSGFLFFS